MNHSEILTIINTPKYWPEGEGFDWSKRNPSGFPSTFNFRVAVQINGASMEELFIDFFYKQSSIPHVPDTISMSMIYSGERIIGLDENGPSSHTNKVGTSLPYYRQRIEHPHIHIPIEEESKNSSYAEPLVRTTELNDLWMIFTERANIHNVPKLELPSSEQLSLPL